MWFFSFIWALNCCFMSIYMKIWKHLFQTDIILPIRARMASKRQLQRLPTTYLNHRPQETVKFLVESQQWKKNKQGYSLLKRSVSSSVGFPAYTMPPKICKWNRLNYQFTNSKMSKVLVIFQQWRCPVQIRISSTQTTVVISAWVSCEQRKKK